MKEVAQAMATDNGLHNNSSYNNTNSSSSNYNNSNSNSSSSSSNNINSSKTGGKSGHLDASYKRMSI